MSGQTAIAAALAASRGRLPASEARLLLGHLLNRPAVWLLTHDDAPLDAATLAAFEALTARRAAGEPIAYLLGHREFFGREFLVSPATLIPRPETELLVEVALRAARKVGADGTAHDGPTGDALPAVADEEMARRTGATSGARHAMAQTARRDETRQAQPVRLLDLGTGSGCVAIMLALALPAAEVVAVDASREALALAAENARRLGARVRFAHSDWFAALAGERFDLIVGNPPYIAAGDAHLAQGDLRFEPASALASGADGLAALRAIIAAAPAHLTTHGQLWLEHGHDQAAAVITLLQAAGFSALEQHRDLAGIVRVSGGACGVGNSSRD